NGLGIVSRLRDLLESLVARHLAGQDQAGEVRPPLVVAELRRQPIALIETRKARFIVLVLVLLPPEALDQLVHRRLLVERNMVERLHDTHAENVAIEDLELEDPGEREALERTRAETPV